MVTLFITTKTQKQAKSPRTGEWMKAMWHNEVLFSHKTGGSAVCGNVDGPSGHSAKRNKPVTDRQALHDSIIHEVSKTVHFIESKRGMAVARGWGEGERRTANHWAYVSVT